MRKIFLKLNQILPLPILSIFFYLSCLSAICSALDGDQPYTIKTFESENPPHGVTPSLIECEIQLNKNVYQYGEPIEFDYVCSSAKDDHFEMPRMLNYPLSFGEGIILQNEQGKEFKFLKLPLIAVALFQGSDKFQNGSIAAKYVTTPPFSCPLIEMEKWIDTWRDTSFTLGQKEALYKEALGNIPVGKYKVRLDIDYTWRENLLLTELLHPESIDPKAVQWWHLQGKPAQVSFEVTAAPR